jgi:hypothetical protein
MAASPKLLGGLAACWLAGLVLASCGGNLAASTDSGPPPADAGNGIVRWSPPTADGSVDGTLRADADSGAPPVDRDVKVGPADAPVPRGDAACHPLVDAGFVPVRESLPEPACSAAEVAAIAGDCFGNVGDASCAPYAGSACLQCIVSSQGASVWGPYVDDGPSYSHANYGGCVARLDPSPAGRACGSAYIAYEQCFEAACVPNCSNPAMTESDMEEFESCQLAATAGGCNSLEESAEALCAPITAATTTCESLIAQAAMTNGSEGPALVSYIAIFCELPDGGLDASQPSHGDAGRKGDAAPPPDAGRRTADAALDSHGD